jgi:hypothetical protein
VTSEYQYYEFQAIDRPLDERATAALRAITNTSRARIAPTSLVNMTLRPQDPVPSLCPRGAARRSVQGRRKREPRKSYLPARAIGATPSS